MYMRNSLTSFMNDTVSKITGFKGKMGNAGKGQIRAVLGMLTGASVMLGVGAAGMSAMYSTDQGHSLLTTGGRHNAVSLSEKEARALVRPAFPQLYYEAKRDGQPVIDHIPKMFKIREYEKGITGEYAKPVPFLGDYMHIRTKAPDASKAVGHELRHAFQAKAMGNSAFDKAYAEDTKKFGYDKNRFEVDANQFEGRINNPIPESIKQEALEYFDRLPYKRGSLLPETAIKVSSSSVSNAVKQTGKVNNKGAYNILKNALRK